MQLPPDPTVEFGPRPPRATPDPERPPRPHRVFLTLLLALVGLAAVASGLAALRRRPSSTPDRSADEPPASVVAACPPVAPQPDDATGRSWAADLLGVGCAQSISWRAPILTIELPDRSVRRYELGQAGDQLLVGRFGCAAGPLLARYRPATGLVVQYPALRSGLEPGGSVEPGTRSQAVPHGVARVGRDAAGCESVEVVAQG